MTDKIVVLTTCAGREEAGKLAHRLVDQRLAACVSIAPGVQSHYRWKGAVETAEECLLLIKTSRALFEPLRIAIEQAHSYEVPEVLALPVVEGAANYLNWLESNLRSENEAG